MASWILVPCLVSLRDEFNRLAPGRDKGADGSIGDLAHQQESSDHNPDETGRTPFEDADNVDEVHAIDIDSTGPWPAGKDLDSRVEIIRLRHKNGHDDRLQNIIWKDRVASRSWGWTWDPRPGIGHFDHAHFSARYTTAQENDTSPWGVLEDEMALNLSTEDKAAIRQECAEAVVNYFRGAYEAVTGAADADTTLNKTKRQYKIFLQAVLGGPVDQVALMTAITGLDQVDEMALAAALLPGLNAGLGSQVIAMLQPLIDAGTLTAAEVQAAVEAGTRNVLRTGVE